MFDKGVPSIIERGDVSRELQELRLIFANSSTRVLTGAELSKQAERVTELLYKLAKKGFKFPGRMREHVAAATNSSSSRIGRLHAIRERLIPVLLQKFDEGLIGETAAYRLSRESAEMQDLIWRSVGISICRIDVQSVDLVIGQIAKTRPTLSSALDASNRVEPEKTVEQKCSAAAGPSNSVSNRALSEYMKERLAEDLRYLDMMTLKREEFIDSIPIVIHDRQQGIDIFKRTFRHRGLGGATVNYEGRGNGLELFEDRDGEHILRSWTEAYDMLCCAAINFLGKNKQFTGAAAPANMTPHVARPADDTAPAWQTGDPDAEGWYCCWATWEPESDKWDPDREFLYWRGCSWFENDRDADRCVPAQYEVHKWYRIPDDPEEGG